MTVKITCDGCGKKVSLNATTRYGRRGREHIDVDNLYWFSDDDWEIALLIHRGGELNWLKENKPKIACSHECVLKLLPGQLKLLDKESKEVQE
jgi:hypothetical protein